MNIYFESIEQNEELQEIVDCLNNILSVPCGSIPLKRGLGMDWDLVSNIATDLENEYTTNLIEQVEKFEPRVAVNSIEFEYDDNGKVSARIEIEKGESWESEA